MTREISGDGIAMVKRFEGFKAKAYLDTGKVLTIGYGQTIEARLSQNDRAEWAST